MQLLCKNKFTFGSSPFSLSKILVALLVAFTPANRFFKRLCGQHTKQVNKPEVESSRTSLASRTHFEVLGLGLEGQVLGLGLETSSPRKLACPRLEDSTIF